MGHLGEVEDHRLTIADGVVLTRDGLGHAEDHRPGELEQQNLAGGLIQQHLLFIGQLHIVIGGADRFHFSGLQRAHPINGEHVGHENSDAHCSDEIHQHRERNHAVGDHRSFHREVVGPLEEIPINDVDAHLQGDARQHSEGNRGRKGRGSQNDHHQNQRTDNA